MLNTNNFDSYTSAVSGVQTALQGGMTPGSAANEPGAKSAEQWLEHSLAYKDYVRQGLVTIGASTEFGTNGVGGVAFDTASSVSTASSTSAPTVRLCTANSAYQLCKSYPAFFLVSRETTDECLRKNAKCHRQNRCVLNESSTKTNYV